MIAAAVNTTTDRGGTGRRSGAGRTRAGQRGGVGGRRAGDRPRRPEQVLDRVAAEERGEQGADGQAGRRGRGRGPGTPCGGRPAVSVAGSERASPATMREKKTPIDSAVPAFWNVARMPEATPR